MINDLINLSNTLASFGFKREAERIMSIAAKSKKVVKLDDYRNVADLFMRRANETPDFPTEIVESADLFLEYISIAEWPNKEQRSLLRDMFKYVNKNKIGREQNTDPDSLYLGYSQFQNISGKAGPYVRVVDLNRFMVRGEVDHSAATYNEIAESNSWPDLIWELLYALDLREATEEEEREFEDFLDQRFGEWLDEFEESGELNLHMVGPDGKEILEQEQEEEEELPENVFRFPIKEAMAMPTTVPRDFAEWLKRKLVSENQIDSRLTGSIQMQRTWKFIRENSGAAERYYNDWKKKEDSDGMLSPNEYIEIIDDVEQEVEQELQAEQLKLF